VAQQDRDGLGPEKPPLREGRPGRDVLLQGPVRPDVHGRDGRRGVGRGGPDGAEAGVDPGPVRPHHPQQGGRARPTVRPVPLLQKPEPPGDRPQAGGHHHRPARRHPHRVPSVPGAPAGAPADVRPAERPGPDDGRPGRVPPQRHPDPARPEDGKPQGDRRVPHQGARAPVDDRVHPARVGDEGRGERAWVLRRPAHRPRRRRPEPGPLDRPPVDHAGVGGRAEVQARARHPPAEPRVEQPAGRDPGHGVRRVHAPQPGPDVRHRRLLRNLVEDGARLPAQGGPRRVHRQGDRGDHRRLRLPRRLPGQRLPAQRPAGPHGSRPLRPRRCRR
jgi:hypothetical protein